MALRIRKYRKQIVCAAESNPQKDDCYLDDNVHYVLGVEMKILHTDDGGRNWYFDTQNLRCRRR